MHTSRCTGGVPTATAKWQVFFVASRAASHANCVSVRMLGMFSQPASLQHAQTSNSPVPRQTNVEPEPLKSKVSAWISALGNTAHLWGLINIPGPKGPWYFSHLVEHIIFFEVSAMVIPCITQLLINLPGR